MTKTILNKAQHFFQYGDYQETIRICKKNINHVDYGKDIEKILKLSYVKRIEQFHKQKEFKKLITIFENSYNLFKTYNGIESYFCAVASTGQTDKLKAFLKHDLDRKAKDALLESIGFLALKDEKAEIDFSEYVPDLSTQKNRILNCLVLFADEKKEELLNELRKISLNSVYKKLGLILKNAINITTEEGWTSFYEKFKYSVYEKMVCFLYCYHCKHFNVDVFKNLTQKSKTILRNYLNLRVDDIKLILKLDGLQLTSERVLDFFISNKKLLSNYNFSNLIVPYLQTESQIKMFENNFHILPKFEKYKILAINYFKNDDLISAIKYLTAALEQLSENVPFNHEIKVVLYYILAQCYQSINQCQKAIAAFTECLVLKREKIYEDLIELYLNNMKKNKQKVFEILQEYKNNFPMSERFLLQEFKINKIYNGVSSAILDLVQQENKKIEFPVDDVLEGIRRKISAKGLNKSLNALKTLPQCENYKPILDALIFIHKQKKPSKQDSTFEQQLCYSIEYYLIKRKPIRLNAKFDAKVFTNVLFLYKEYELRELLPCIVEIDSNELKSLNLEEALNLCKALDTQMEPMLLHDTSSILARKFENSLDILFYKYFTHFIISCYGIDEIKSSEEVRNQMAFFLYYIEKLDKKDLLEKIIIVFYELECEPTTSYIVKKLPHDLQLLNKALR